MVERFDIGFIDYLIVALYVVATVGLGLWAGRGSKRQGAEGYFLAGRNMIWPLVGLSIFATNQSGSSLIAYGSSGYASGITIYAYEIMGGLALIFFLFFFLPLFRRASVFTTPEFLGKRFGRGPYQVFAAYLLLEATFVSIGAGLYSGGIALQLLFPGLPLWVLITGLAVLTGVYTIVGGLSAVIITDAVQAVLLILGSAVMAIIIYVRVDSLGQIGEAAPAESLSLIQPANDPTLPWPALFTGLIVIAIWFACFNQIIVQRAFGARSLDHGRWGSLFGGFLKLTILFILIIPGVAAHIFYPNIENPDLVFPVLAFGLMPVGVQGLMLAALIAAIMSTVSSVLNAVSTIVTMDLIGSVRPHLQGQGLVRTGRVITALLMLFGVVWAPQIVEFPTLWQYLQSVVSFTTPPVVAVFLLGAFWARTNQAGALTALAVGIPIGVLGFSVTQVPALQLFEIHYLYAAAILFVVACLLMVGVSLVTRSPAPERVEGLTWSRALWQEDSRELATKRWYKNYRILSGGVAVIAIVIAIPFL